ncbi:MAG TPA: LysM domain-containing protein [Solirubrobacterales bacterium]|nr:LysM domain-containing protein [Solirubrobacterales bacterium]
MNKTSNLITRLLAVAALVAAVVVVLVVISGNTGGDDDPGKKGNQTAKTNGQSDKKKKSKRASYEVQEGDTLTAISQKTGVSVDEIEELNPELDPQALQAGQNLKLR